MALEVPEKSHKLSVMLAEIRRTLRRQKLCRSATLHVSEGANGTIAEVVRRAGGGGGTLRLLIITEVLADALTCGSDTVARPIHLRASGPGFTYPDFNTRRSNFQVTTNTTQALDEFITPAYTVGDEIIAAELESTSIEDVSMEDVNADGRIWLLAKRVVGVCELINGVPTAKKMITYGSPSF